MFIEKITSNKNIRYTSPSLDWSKACEIVVLLKYEHF